MLRVAVNNTAPHADWRGARCSDGPRIGAYLMMGLLAAETHCHLPSDCFIQMSV
jgi:hypothetical protein